MFDSTALHRVWPTGQSRTGREGRELWKCCGSNVMQGHGPWGHGQGWTQAASLPCCSEAYPCLQHSLTQKWLIKVLACTVCMPQSGPLGWSHGASLPNFPAASSRSGIPREHLLLPAPLVIPKIISTPLACWDHFIKTAWAEGNGGNPSEALSSLFFKSLFERFPTRFLKFHAISSFW